MPLNTTESELRASAASDLAEKLKLERQQIIELRSLFNDMASDMDAFAAETGEAPSATAYEDDLRGILAKQGRRVGTAFSGEITDFLDDAPEDESIIEELALIAAVGGLTVVQMVDRMRNEIRRKRQAFTAAQVASDTRIITSTNQREMDAAMVSARVGILEAGRTVTNAEVASIASKDFRNSGLSRAPTIAATFTQKIAEGTKDIERDTFFTARNGVPAVVADVPQIEETEIWVTVGDEKVRPSHVAADMTRKDEGGWVVQGEFLRFPGDPFRGSASNVINCRCAAETVIE